MDVLTPEERAAIDAYPEDRITRVPQGVMATGLLQWDEDKRRLSYSNPSDAKAAIRATWSRPAPRRAYRRDPDVAERRQKVTEMIEAGMCGPEIARALNAPVHTIRQDAKVLGLSLSASAAARYRHKTKPTGCGIVVDEHFCRMWREGVPSKVMAERLGFTAPSINRAAKRAGLPTRRLPTCRRPLVVEETDG